MFEALRLQTHHCVLGLLYGSLHHRVSSTLIPDLKPNIYKSPYSMVPYFGVLYSKDPTI